MPDYGLLAGLGEGLKGAFQTYAQERNRQDDRRQKDLTLALEAKSKGFQLNPDGTTWEPDQESDEYSNALRTAAIEAYKQGHPGSTDEQAMGLIPEKLTADQYEKIGNQYKGQISPMLGFEGRKLMADAIGGRTEVARGQLGLSQAKAASDIAEKVKNDKIVAQTDLQQAAIQKGLDRLNSDQPLTPQMLSDIQIDLANAISGGKVAAQGTIHRVEMDTLANKVAKFQQYLTSSPTDVNSPEVKNYLNQTFNELNKLNQNIRSRRVNSLTGQKEAAFGSKGPFGEVLGKLREEASGQPAFSPEDEQAIKWAKSNRGNSDAEAILKMHGIK